MTFYSGKIYTMSLITLSELKSHMQITVPDYDASLQRAVDAANAYIVRVTGRYWGEIVNVVDEAHDYAPIIFTEYPCVTAVTSVKVGGEVQDADTYTWSDTGRIRMSHNIRRQTTTYDFDDVEVSYSTGTLTIPGDLKEAALMIAQMSYDQGLQGGKQVSREKVGSREVEYSIASTPAHDVVASYKGL